MSLLRNLTFLIWLIPFSLPLAQELPRPHPGAVVVRIRQSSVGPSYWIGDKRMALPALNTELVEIIGRHGQHQAVNVIADDTVTIGTLENLRGLIEKIGFSNVSYFVASEASPKMGELIFGKVVPQSTAPPRNPSRKVPPMER